MARERGHTLKEFPVGGLHVISSRVNQPPRTCVNCRNVRAFDLLEDRARGGIRPGLKKYLTNTFSGAGIIQDINYVTLVRDADPATGSLYVRDTRAVAVSNGAIQWFQRSNVVNTAVNGTKQLYAAAPFIMSTDLFGKVYYADGRNYQVWDGGTNEASDWTLTAGTLPGTPGNTNTNTSGRLIETWDGRVVIAGLRSDPHNYFMSAKGDPLDYDYAPANSTELQAVTGGVGVVGKVPDIINAMIPYSDDILIFGCDHSIYQMSGNPMAGGRIDNVSTRIGMPFGRPWCKDPEGNVYFFSSLGDVYKMPPYGAKPAKVSDAIHPLLKDVNLNTTFVQMEWNDAYEGVNLWLSPFNTSQETTHYFWDARTSGWFPDKYAAVAYNPIAVKLFDGDEAADRVVLIGSSDGKIRYLDSTVANDDGTAFTATATVGPFMGGEDHVARQILTGLQARTDPDGANTKYEVMVGDTPELAQEDEAATFVGEGTFKAGFSLRSNPMKGGFFIYIKVGTNTDAGRWGFEALDGTIEVIAGDAGNRLASS
jgi:hypothetical protein